MIDVFRSLKSLLKISRVHIDNTIFRLHYSLTVIILLAFCVVVTTKQYVGDPIECIRSEGVPASIINTYCWIHTTYTMPRALYDKPPGKSDEDWRKDNPHPAISADPKYNNPNDFRYHKYYQWVCFVLFIQATFFYIPRWLWKSWEGGRIAALMMDLDVGCCSDIEKKTKKKLLIDYLISSKGHHDWYAARYFCCELMAFANVIGQMFAIDKFFQGEFMNYGFEALEYWGSVEDNHVNPMERVFPKMSKCKFYKFGASGTVEKLDALCLLPINIINEKIYIFCWFWFLFLALVTGIMILFHLVLIACPPVRVYVLNMRFRLTQLEHLHTIVRKTSIGDWFLIYMLGNNVDSVIFKELVEELASSPDHSGKDERMSLTAC